MDRDVALAPWCVLPPGVISGLVWAPRAAPWRLIARWRWRGGEDNVERERWGLLGVMNCEAAERCGAPPSMWSLGVGGVRRCRGMRAPWLVVVTVAVVW